jgi:DNA-binding MarR family transcriptional regulator
MIDIGPIKNAERGSSNEPIDRPRLEELAQLASRIGHSLQALQEGIERETIAARTTGETVGSAAGIGNLQLDVREARKLRELRKTLLGTDFFSGPAWDILLHLFESHLLQRRDSVGNVCDGTEVPAATALRWIARLEQSGFVRAWDDHLDRRRRFVELTETGVELITRYFSGAAPHAIAA